MPHKAVFAAEALPNDARVSQWAEQWRSPAPRERSPPSGVGIAVRAFLVLIVPLGGSPVHRKLDDSPGGDGGSHASQQPPPTSGPGSPAGASAPGTSPSTSDSTGPPEAIGGEGTEGMDAPKAAEFLAVRTLAGLVASGLLISSSVLALAGDEASDAHLLATIGGLTLGAVAVWAHNRVVRLESSTRL